MDFWCWRVRAEVAGAEAVEAREPGVEKLGVEGGCGDTKQDMDAQTNKKEKARKEGEERRFSTKNGFLQEIEGNNDTENKHSMTPYTLLWKA